MKPLKNTEKFPKVSCYLRPVYSSVRSLKLKLLKPEVIFPLEWVKIQKLKKNNDNRIV